MHGILVGAGWACVSQRTLTGVISLCPLCWDKPQVTRLGQQAPFLLRHHYAGPCDVCYNIIPKQYVEGQSLDVSALGAQDFMVYLRGMTGTLSHDLKHQLSELLWITQVPLLQWQNALRMPTDPRREVPASFKCLRVKNNRPAQNCSQRCFRERTQIPHSSRRHRTICETCYCLDDCHFCFLQILPTNKSGRRKTK